MTDQKCLFDNETMKQFITNGFTVVKTDFPGEFHDEIYRRTSEAIAREGNPGNNLLPMVPQIQQIYDHPKVKGALTSILGPDYIMHSHRHPHVNAPESIGGRWHKDSYWGYKKMRDHHPRWVMAMYYPQDVTVENGPTGVIPGTQYFETRPENEDAAGIPMTGEAGSLIIIHFDLWHRAYPNLSGNTRYMMKFQFTRMTEPTKGHWQKPAEQLALNGDAADVRAPLWSNVWDWLSGSNGSSMAIPDTGITDIDRLSKELISDSEPERLRAAYSLPLLGVDAVPVLMNGLRHENDEVKRDACYGLGPAGVPAIPELVGSLVDNNEMIRGYAAYALGDMGNDAEGAVPELVRLVGDSSDWVRRNVSEALGNIAADAEASVPALVQLMKDEDGQVRFNSAYSLAKFGNQAREAVSVLQEGLGDENRYVQGHSAAALEKIGTTEAMNALLSLIHTSRWCPVTNKDTTF
ncbi:MAG: phytanoyl-CoA dioxygenase [Candidatus Latescibacteria bacterium]|jgi:hypothetical protein|nr:phytanoyl-CoA dioxygenase [Candidatus Latescibacterota bacterium]